MPAYRSLQSLPRVALLAMLALLNSTVLLSIVHAAQPAAVAAPRKPVPRGPLDSEERATIDLFENARRSVVYIATTQRMVDPWTRNPLQVQSGTGSGFLWDTEGHVVTNNH